MNRTTDAFRKDDLHLASKVEPLETVVDELVRAIKARHVARLQAGSCSIEYGFVLEDLLTNYERVCDHCSNVAVAQIEVAQDSFDTHAYLNDLRSGHASTKESEQFQRRLNRYRERYLFPDDKLLTRNGGQTGMIYIVEDDSAIRELEQYALQSNGYEAVGFESSEPFWQAVHTTPPELVILDVMLPGEDGFSILKKLRNRPFPACVLPIIMITAEVQRAGHRARPRLRRRRLHHQTFGIMEFLSRVRAALRRAGPRRGPMSTASGRSLLDNARHSVTVSGAPGGADLQRVQLLRLLLENTNLVVTRETILQVVWGTDISVESRTVDMHIRTLRKKLGDAGKYICTVRKVGYKLTDSEEELEQ